MIYQRQRIVADVLAAIDQECSAGVRDDETGALTVADIASGKIEDAARMVMISAPANTIDTAVHIHDTPVSDGSGNWRVSLPDDYLRLVSVRLSDWERPVTDAITPSHPRYRHLRSRLPGLRGTPSRPAASVERTHNSLTLTLYGSRAVAPELIEGLIALTPRFDRSGGIDLPAQLYRAVVYHAAALTLTASGQGDFAGLMFNLAQQQ